MFVCRGNGSALRALIKARFKSIRTGADHYKMLPKL
jgi:hypothetical protein